MRFHDQLTWLAAIVATNISRLFIFSRCVQAFATPTATLRSVSGRTETGVEAYHEDTHVLPHAERKRRGKQCSRRSEVHARRPEVQVVVFGESRPCIREGPFEPSADRPARCVETDISGNAGRRAQECGPSRRYSRGKIVLHPGGAAFDVKQAGRRDGEAGPGGQRTKPQDRGVGGK